MKQFLTLMDSTELSRSKHFSAENLIKETNILSETNKIGSNSRRKQHSTYSIGQYSGRRGRGVTALLGLV